jgi:hypothetical protein
VGARVVRGGLGTLLVLGCTQIFGIEEACVIDEPGCGVAALGLTNVEEKTNECRQYCAAMDAQCTNLQYTSEKPGECESLCLFFEREAEGTPAGNDTFECRLARATSMSREASDCRAAGRGGDNVCGASCDAYCSLMQAICPMRFGQFAEGESELDDEAECRAECAVLVDRLEYDPRPMGGVDEFDYDDGQPTVQCRLWHLGSAASDAVQFGMLDSHHCAHAVGVGDCLPVEAAP